MKKKDKFDSFLLENIHKKIAVVEIGVGVFGKTARVVGDSLLKNAKNLSYMIINPRGREYRTLRNMIEKGEDIKSDTIDTMMNHDDLPTHLKAEVEFYQSIRNEVIKFPVGANEGISMIHSEIKNLVYSE